MLNVCSIWFLRYFGVCLDLLCEFEDHLFVSSELVVGEVLLIRVMF